MIGTVAGVLAGLLCAVAIAAKTYHGWVFAYFPREIVLRDVLLATLLGTVLSVVAAILPAYWAARRKPVDAMRVEQ